MIRGDGKWIPTQHPVEPRLPYLPALRSSLKEVAVQTYERGHMSLYFYIELLDRDANRLVIPSYAVRDTSLVDRLKALPSFDDAAYQRAAEGGRDARAICWTS
jgi:hypothetical protein